MDYRIDHHLPTPDEYRQLRASVGWVSEMNLKVAGAALANSVFGITARTEDGAAIAMGRIVGDGVLYYYVQDLIVTPEYQRQGIGTQILNALLGYIRNHAPDRFFVGLFSVPEAVAFYQRFKLEQRDLVGLVTFKETMVGA